MGLLFFILLRQICESKARNAFQRHHVMDYRGIVAIETLGAPQIIRITVKKGIDAQC